MGSMHTRLESLDRSIDRLSLFYAERARGGAGLIVTGGYAPCQDGLLDETGPLLVTPDQADSPTPIPPPPTDTPGHQPPPPLWR